ncbi:MAG: hypothetical protein AB1512_01020 [Thermodesulfobacteriota bacterium]
MHLFAQIYEFAASAGAFEGYVYRRQEMDEEALRVWIGNLQAAYGILPRQVLDKVQPAIDQTLGRAFRSLSVSMGENHEITAKCRSMIQGELPAGPDDFRKKKWFQ